jgi:hypothetical protein
MMKQYVCKSIFVFFYILCCFDTTAQYNDTLREFYPNGKLKSVHHEGLFNGCTMPVGTDTAFYKSGKISETIFYDNRKSKTEEGCHEGWTTEIKKIFFENGRIKTISQTKYGYEGTPCNCGTWIWKDVTGRIHKKKYYGKCYDQVSCN